MTARARASGLGRATACAMGEAAPTARFGGLRSRLGHTTTDLMRARKRPTDTLPVTQPWGINPRDFAGVFFRLETQVFACAPGEFERRALAFIAAQTRVTPGRTKRVAAA